MLSEEKQERILCSLSYESSVRLTDRGDYHQS